MGGTLGVSLPGYTSQASVDKRLDRLEDRTSRLSFNGVEYIWHRLSRR
jgi:hypothetical protein